MHGRKTKLESKELDVIANDVDTETMKMIAIKYLDLKLDDIADIKGKSIHDTAIACLERWRKINQDETKDMRELLYRKLAKASDEGLIHPKSFSFLYENREDMDHQDKGWSKDKLSKAGLSYQILNPKKIGIAVLINNLGTEYPETTQELSAMAETFSMMKFDTHVYEDCDDMVNLCVFHV